MGRSESFRLIQAAGGIVTRDGRICVVRRTRYGPEWSLPKGKLEKGETFEEAAVREVEEETCCRTEIVDLVAAIDYRVRKGPKVVLFFEMQLIEERPFQPSEEIEALEWMLPEEAIVRLTYPAEQRVVDRFLRDRGGEPSPDA